MQTDRMTILMDPKYKAAIAKLAAKRGVSTSEHVRNALDCYKVEADENEAELAALTGELEQALPEMREDFDAILASLRTMNDKIETYRAERLERRKAA